MSDRRRAEIEAKRQKLAELRKAREDRQKAEAERKRANEVALLRSHLLETVQLTLLDHDYRLGLLRIGMLM